MNDRFTALFCSGTYLAAIYQAETWQSHKLIIQGQQEIKLFGNALCHHPIWTQEPLTLVQRITGVKGHTESSGVSQRFYLKKSL